MGKHRRHHSKHRDIYRSISPLNIFSSPPLSPTLSISSLSMSSVSSLSLSPTLELTIEKKKTDTDGATISIPANALIKSTPYELTITPRPLYPALALNVDTGMGGSYIAQKQMVEYFLYKTLDKWLWNDKLNHLLKYFVVKDEHVTLLDSIDAVKKNKINEDGKHNTKLKIKYINRNYLTEYDMKMLLLKITDRTYVKWFELTDNERIVIKCVDKMLSKKFKKIINKEI
jgi:hypothetical protein